MLSEKKSKNKHNPEILVDNYDLKNIANMNSLRRTSPLMRTLIRNVSKSATNRDMEQKTTVHVLNNDQEAGLMINGFSQVGFRLNNGMTILGPMVIFTRSVLAWNIEDFTNINEDSLSLFKILEPKIDIIVLGIGDRQENHKLHGELLTFSRKQKITFEILPTEQACATFNFLNSEGRNVVGAMIPPKNIRFTEDDELRTKLRYQNLYEIP